MEHWKNIERSVILASQSPRRAEILSVMGLNFTVDSPQGVDEQSFFSEAMPVVTSLKDVAVAKAQSVAQYNPSALVIGSDTVVAFGDRVMGKPENYEDAVQTLQMLSGKTHSVFSGVAIIVQEKEIILSTVAQTKVTFREISLEEIEAYLALNRFSDKAGSYAIQEEAMTFVEKIDGCYNNIVGFPVAASIGLFQEYHTLKGDDRG